MPLNVNYDSTQATHKIFATDTELIGTHQFWLYSEATAYDAPSTPRIYFHGPFTFEILSDIAQKSTLPNEACKDDEGNITVGSALSFFEKSSNNPSNIGNCDDEMSDAAL